MDTVPGCSDTPGHSFSPGSQHSPTSKVLSELFFKSARHLLFLLFVRSRCRADARAGWKPAPAALFFCMGTVYAMMRQLSNIPSIYLVIGPSYISGRKSRPRVPDGPAACIYESFYLSSSAIASISTSAPFGSFETSTQLRAGFPGNSSA